WSSASVVIAQAHVSTAAPDEDQARGGPIPPAIREQGIPTFQESTNPRPGVGPTSPRAHLGEQLRLVVGDQRVDDLVDLAFHHPVELVEGEVDAVVGDAALGE